ncbi:LacI family DNA-binding transcriptional regulator [Georgenia sp. MJ278]|uniref:LacI family DNA-binding transcriptional regulator n=1 Tax=Georgenia wangjunii TaxID=3117730 RepID=UPI002F260DAA
MDVAKLAGVSPAVVSYVINEGTRPVAPATRARVLAAIKELGYRPNRLAASLRSSKSHTIGVLVPDNSNPFFAELARAIEDAAFVLGYTILLGNAKEIPSREVAYVCEFLDRQVTGIAIIPAYGPAEWTSHLVGRDVRCVLLDRDLDGTDGLELPLVRSAGEDGGYEATAHLLGHRRRRLAMIAGPEGLAPAEERVRGMRRAVTEHGADPDLVPVQHVPFNIAAGYRATLELLAHHPQTDAIFVSSDIQALGVLRALTERGLTVPGDVAIVSFDGIPLSAYTSPPLTTVQQGFDELGREVLNTLVAEADARPRVRSTTIPTSLRIRSSCGCVPAPSYTELGAEGGGAM